MRMLILEDGTRIAALWASANGHALTVATQGDMSVADAAAAFGDPAKTATITEEGAPTPRAYTGYTDLVVVNRSGRDDGYTLVILEKSEG